jgi:hypothetical protein
MTGLRIDGVRVQNLADIDWAVPDIYDKVTFNDRPLHDQRCVSRNLSHYAFIGIRYSVKWNEIIYEYEEKRTPKVARKYHLMRIESGVCHETGVFYDADDSTYLPIYLLEREARFKRSIIAMQNGEARFDPEIGIIFGEPPSPNTKPDDTEWPFLYQESC